MRYEKKIPDMFRDDATVSVGINGGDESVLLEFTADACHEMAYTPSQARRLARALKRAANVAEGKPAKAPKGPKFPRVIVDYEDDHWYRTDDGDEDRYTLGHYPDNGYRSPRDDYADMTREHIAREYGIAEERP